MVLFLFLVHLAIGIVFTLALVSREAGVKFFRFNAGLSAILIAVAFAFRPADLASTTAQRVAFGSLVAVEAAVVFYWATIGRAFARVRPAVALVALAGGVVALVGQAAALAAGRGAGAQVLTIASFLSSAALLGGACTAMILGHWYLVIPSLQV